jgi:hypothetical protein
LIAAAAAAVARVRSSFSSIMQRNIDPSQPLHPYDTQGCHCALLVLGTELYPWVGPVYQDCTSTTLQLHQPIT